MSIVCIAIGDAVMGCRTHGPDGEVIKETKAHWDHNPEGGAVAIWTTDGETDESEAPWRCMEIGMPPTTLPECWSSSTLTAKSMCRI